MPAKSTIIIALVVLVAAGLVGTTFLTQPTQIATTTTTQVSSGKTTALSGAPAWMQVTLKDPRTGQTFKLGDFRGKVVVLEIMAVWCPRCVSQADEIQKTVDTLSPDLKQKVVFVSVDVDPNENEQSLANYANSFNRTWPFVYDNTGEFLKAFVRDRGTTVGSEIPTTPVYIVDPSGKLGRIGPSGGEEIKSAAVIVSAINSALG